MQVHRIITHSREADGFDDVAIVAINGRNASLHPQMKGFAAL
jgi:hypothetical protein